MREGRLALRLDAFFLIINIYQKYYLAQFYGPENHEIIQRE